MSIPQNKTQYPWKPPPQEWRGPWPPPAGSGGFPNAFPQPPPMPPGFAYGNRAWINGRWAMAPMGANYQPGRPGQGRKPGSDEYWATKLVDNPLGLENMIPANQLPPESSKANGHPEAPQPPAKDHNYVWVPALTDEHPRGRVHLRTVSNGSRSSSQPTRRGTKESSPPPPLPVPPLTPYHPGAELHHREPPSARTRPQSSAAHHRRVEEATYGRDRNRSGRMSVPPGRDRYGSVPWAFAPQPAQAASHAQRPALDSDSDTTSTQRPLSRGMSQTRSYTLPPEDGQRRHQTHDFYATYGRRNSASASASRPIQRSQTMPPELQYPAPSHAQPSSGARYQAPLHDNLHVRQEYSSKNIYSPPRDANGQYGQVPRMPTPEPEEGEFERPDPASVDRVRKWLAKNETMNRASPTIRRTVDGYENPRDVSSPARMEPYSARRVVEDVTRSASLPAVIPDSGRRQAIFNNHTAGFSDEPGELAHGLAAATLNDNDYVGPNELSSRARGLGRSDTLIIEDNVDHPEHLLPSPRSLNQTNATFSSRGSGGRSSFDQSLGHQAGLQPSPRHSFTSGGSHSRHVSPANSMQFHQTNGGSSKANYSTPPITPNRTSYPHHQEPRGPYSMPNASGSRSNITSSTSNSPHITPYRNTDPVHQRSPSAQPSPSVYHQGARYRQQHLYQHEGGSSSSLSLSNPGLGRHPSQRHQASNAQNYHQESQHIYQPQRASGKGRSNEELRRSPSPNVDPHHPHQQMQQQAYTRPTAHHATPMNNAIPPTSSPSYGRAQAHNRHGSPAVEKRTPRNVRHGLWNRRGDHLTEDGYVVYCPPGRNFPRELSNYPENSFMDHTGRVIHERPESHPEHPASIPSGTTPPSKPYDTFIDYVLVDV
ncbi:hypothetical protein SCHPADRAFT_926760 [Schizopora paradoxa]|uniref:Uncharacterized protein n=1 Tax=Schizopora paradoxa TaxID=27342 RepID=A0A0H2RWX9_9AGAM|nr:hypothetical protein SCHPADRAFT_926760 [Schizopora paradoxa]